MDKNVKKDFSFADVVSVGLKWFWVILIGTLIMGAAALYYAKFCVTPMYKSTSKCYVQANQEAVETSSSDALIGEQRGIALSQMVVVNYIEIFDTNNFAAEIEYYLNGGVKETDSAEKIAALKDVGKVSKKYSAKALRGMISCEMIEETSVFTVDVKGDNYKDVGKIAKYIEIIMADYVESKAPGSGEINVIDDAYENSNPVNNYTILFTLAGLVAGAFITFAIVFIIDCNDTRIKDEETLTQLLSLPVIGTIPDVSGNERTNTAMRK